MPWLLPVFVLKIRPDLSTDLEVDTVIGIESDSPRSSKLRITSSIDRTQMLQLVSSIEYGHFWQLRQDYSSPVTDQPSRTIQVATPERDWLVRVSGVRCPSQRPLRGDESVEPVPDVFCALERKLEAITCQTYTRGQARALTAKEEVVFPPHCDEG